MKELKYKSEIEKMECDFTGFYEQNKIAYRWTFGEIEDTKNFKPRYLLKPTIKRQSCIGWGLSFFNTKENGIKRIKELEKHTPNIRKKLGTHIAIGELNKDDGISNNANNIGHFTLFEYKNVNLSIKFSILEEL